MEQRDILSACKTIERSRRRYSLVQLKLCGSRRLSTTSLSVRSPNQLQVIPQVSGISFSSSPVTAPMFPPSVCRPLTIEEASLSGPLLPLHQQNVTDKLTLVLDLDETLIHAAIPQMEVTSDAAHDFSFLIDGHPGLARSREVIVWKRPGLSEFLEKASRIADIIVFTASVKEYAAPLLDIIDPDGLISARLYRDSAVQTACGVVKDLSLLGRDLSRVVIVDNDPVSFIRHPDNAILIRSFRGHVDDVSDASFAVLFKLLEELAPLKDVRPALAARFGLRNFFRALSPDIEACVKMSPPPSPTSVSSPAVA